MQTGYASDRPKAQNLEESRTLIIELEAKGQAPELPTPWT